MPVQHPWSTALVTGASSGIGAAIARQLAAAGIRLTIVARRQDRLDELVTELTRPGRGHVDAIAADLTDRVAVAEVVSRLTDPERPVDLLVNCAGVGASGPFAEGDLDAYRRVIDLNVTALVELSHAVVAPMSERKRGWIMNISSLGGHAPGPSFAVYCATKAFVTSFSESLHEELGSEHVVVTAICPGATDTEFGETAGSSGDALPGFLWQSVDQVATEALVATAAGKAVRVTGVANRVSASITTVLPRTANRKLAALVTDRL